MLCCHLCAPFLHAQGSEELEYCGGFFVRVCACGFPYRSYMHPLFFCCFGFGAGIWEFWYFVLCFSVWSYLRWMYPKWKLFTLFSVLGCYTILNLSVPSVLWVLTCESLKCRTFWWIHVLGWISPHSRDFLYCTFDGIDTVITKSKQSELQVHKSEYVFINVITISLSLILTGLNL